MTSRMEGRPLGPGDRAPDFELPAADTDATISLAAYRGRGPVLLSLLRGLYCPFCRRHISQIAPACESMRGAGIALIGVVIASAARARTYFRHFPACFPIAAAPDRTVHRAYGLPEVSRTPELSQSAERRAAEVLREMGIEAAPGKAGLTFFAAGGFEATPEDQEEYRRPLQSVGCFLIGPDGVIRWGRVEVSLTALPPTEALRAHL